MALASETLVRWYLRFNGYLGAENLVVHEPGAGAVPQGAEFDVVAVRFPFSREIADFELPRDARLSALEKPGVVNVVIAEIKAGRDATLNEVWKPGGDEAVQAARLSYLVRWLGFYEHETAIGEVAADLRRSAVSDREHFFRVIYFGARRSQQADELKIPQVLLGDIASWFVSTRASCWRDRDIAKRSCHDQWDPLIKSIWNLADPELPGPAEAKVNAILALTIGRAVP